MPSSTSSSHRAFTSLAFLLAAFAAACSGSTADTSGDDGAPGAPNPARGGDPAKAPPLVNGTPDANEITDTFGVFVAATGRPDNDGSHEHPLDTIQAGIDLGKQSGKRVYVCTGTFREALVLADSISIIGGLDCAAGSWKVGAARTRIEAPSSPAVRAKDITSPTRLEALEILSPNAIAPSTSSIGLLAEHANALVIARSKIVAGDGAKGEDGTEGVQLTQSPSANGEALVGAAECVNGSTCNFLGGVGGAWYRHPGGAGGTNRCVGGPAFEAQPGGAGGSGGLWMPVNEVSTWTWHYYRDQAANGPDPGTTNRTSAPGRDGLDGANAAPLGTFSRDGYAAADGSAGTHGDTGSGGAGGRGDKLVTDPNSPSVTRTSVWRGFGGSGGGAGGCPGLAGTQGKGGGASIAVLLIESATSIDATEILSGHGGNAGRGALGSTPTAGGAGGPNSAVSVVPLSSGKPGGRGGAAGTSGNGSNGPSIGIAHLGAGPAIVGNTKITPGAGGNAIEERTRDVLGITKTIHATPAGLSKDILAL